MLSLTFVTKCFSKNNLLLMVFPCQINICRQYLICKAQYSAWTNDSIIPVVLLQGNILWKSLNLVNVVDQHVVCMIWQKNKLSQVLSSTDAVGVWLMDSIHMHTNLFCDRLDSPQQQLKNCTFNTTNFGQLRMWMSGIICFLPFSTGKKADSSQQNYFILHRAERAQIIPP